MPDAKILGANTPSSSGLLAMMTRGGNDRTYSIADGLGRRAAPAMARRRPGNRPAHVTKWRDDLREGVMASDFAMRRRDLLKAAGAGFALSAVSAAAASAQSPTLSPDMPNSVGPATAELNGKLYAAWKGLGSDDRLWYASFDGAKWSAQTQIPNATSGIGPSLVTFGNALYAAWKGDGTDEHLWYATFDGTTWSAQAQIPGASSSTGPTLSLFNNQLYAMWQGYGTDTKLHYASFDGTKWSAQAAVPGIFGQDMPKNIGLKMQYQETGDWCWIAVATSIAHYYDPKSTVTQCALMTTIGQSINKWPKTTQCCPTAAAEASDTGLPASLASPFTKTTYNVLGKPAAGIPAVCIKTGGVSDALNANGNWKKPALRSLTLAQITTEMNAKRPIATDIKWHSGGQHCVAIAGVLDDMLLICDPIAGESVIQYEAFPSAYLGGASLVSACLTQKKA
jgi:hypothetical protein